MMANKGKRLLLVEDNEKILYGNKQLFEWEGFETTTALTLAEARVALEERRPDAIVLDILLPDGSGLDFMCELRMGENASIPILLLTGLTTKEDVVRGLKAGGDDYLTKPFDFPELLARVEALLRRAARVPEIIEKGRFSFDMTAGVASLDGTDLQLSPKEFALLLVFIQNDERFISAEYLYEKAWKRPMAGDSKALKSALGRLREKISGSGWCITWSRGEGYIFERE